MTIRQFLASLLLVAVSSSAAAALEKKKFCLYDPVGNNGPAIAFFSDLKAKGMAWGLDVEIVNPWTQGCRQGRFDLRPRNRAGLGFQFV